MDDELARLMTLVDHDGDTRAVERWFEAVEKAYRNDDGQAESWDAFQARFYEEASSFDSAQVNWFLEKAAAEFDDQLRIVERFYTQVGAGRAVASYAQARTEVGLDESSGEETPAEPDWDRFGAFLTRNDSQWQATWPDSREWLEYAARQEGFDAEIDSFVGYIDAGWSLTDTITGHRGTPAAAEPDWDRFGAFLTRNDSQWQATWPESREWLEHTAREEGFHAETDSFVGYIDAGWSLTDTITGHRGTPAAAEPTGPDWARFATLLSENRKQHTKAWGFLRGWLVAEARVQGLTVEAASFVEYVEAGRSVPDALVAYGVAAERDWNRFAAFLTSYQERWTMPSVAFRSWLTVEAEAEGLAAEAEDFAQYVRSGHAVPEAAVAYGATPLAAPAAPAAHEEAPEETTEASTPEQVIADVERRVFSEVVAGSELAEQLTDAEWRALVAEILQERLVGAAA